MWQSCWSVWKSCTLGDLDSSWTCVASSPAEAGSLVGHGGVGCLLAVRVGLCVCTLRSCACVLRSCDAALVTSFLGQSCIMSRHLRSHMFFMITAEAIEASSKA